MAICNAVTAVTFLLSPHRFRSDCALDGLLAQSDSSKIAQTNIFTRYQLPHLFQRANSLHCSLLFSPDPDSKRVQKITAQPALSSRTPARPTKSYPASSAGDRSEIRGGGEILPRRAVCILGANAELRLSLHSTLTVFFFGARRLPLPRHSPSQAFVFCAGLGQPPFALSPVAPISAPGMKPLSIAGMSRTFTARPILGHGCARQVLRWRSGGGRPGGMPRRISVGPPPTATMSADLPLLYPCVPRSARPALLSWSAARPVAHAPATPPPSRAHGCLAVIARLAAHQGKTRAALASPQGAEHAAFCAQRLRSRILRAQPLVPRAEAGLLALRTRAARRTRRPPPILRTLPLRPRTMPAPRPTRCTTLPPPLVVLHSSHDADRPNAPVPAPRYRGPALGWGRDSVLAGRDGDGAFPLRLRRGSSTQDDRAPSSAPSSPPLRMHTDSEIRFLEPRLLQAVRRSFISSRVLKPPSAYSNQAHRAPLELSVPRSWIQHTHKQRIGRSNAPTLALFGFHRASQAWEIVQ
ncbi:hypothetical protein DFH09DRAFT_1365066 [Mycena vulgaris]|nr:hypothetical protein DFH09DRAFT_1365066 [Mycena vulgaris]